RLSPQTNVQTNVMAAQAGFQTPNTYDQQSVGQDQRQRQHTINVASSLNRVLSPSAVVEANGWFRRDHFEYDGSANLFSVQTASLRQRRLLTNCGVKAPLF